MERMEMEKLEMEKSATEKSEIISQFHPKISQHFQNNKVTAHSR